MRRTLAPRTSGSPAASMPSRWQQLAKDLRRHRVLYILLLPTLISIGVFYYYPLLSGLYHSFTYWDLKRTVWIGLENYQRMLADPTALVSWRNMAVILLSQLVIVTTTPLLGAVLVYRLPPGRAQYLWRIAFVLPIVVPTTVVVFVWRWFYGVEGGFNTILHALGLSSWTRIWLGEITTALPSIIFTGFPWVAGLNFLIYLAALQSISTEVIDASKVDGAGSIRRFFAIELPLIRNQMLLLITLTFIYYLRSFDAPLIMTNGGPGTSGTLVPGLQMYRAIRDDLDLGYGSAIGTVLFFVMIGLTFLNLAIRRRNEQAERGARDS